MIILASASPRRKEILKGLGVDFDIITADTDERSEKKDPVEYARQIAEQKGLAVWKRLEDEEFRGKDESEYVIISADTVVCLDGEILGKPKDRADAERMIRKLSGKEHLVVSGVAVTVHGVAHSDASVTKVRIQTIPDEEIIRYVESGDSYDKAGAYGIQGRFSAWVEGIEGCYFGVVGLPTNTLCNLYYRCTGKRLV